MAFTLALATDRVHALLEPTLLAPIRDEKERAEVVRLLAVDPARALERLLGGVLEAHEVGVGGGDVRRQVLDQLVSARMLIEAVGDLVDRPEDRGSQDKVESDFLSTAETVLPHYEKNLDSLNWIKDQLGDPLRRKEAEQRLEQIEKLLADTGRSQVAEQWGLLDETDKLAESVEKVRGEIRSAGVGAMERELERPGLPQVLQAWTLLSQGSRAAEGETTDPKALTARTADLRSRIAEKIAAKLGFDLDSSVGDESVKRDEPVKRDESSERMEFVKRIATSRLLVDEAEKDLDDDPAMQFLLRRRKLAQQAAQRASRDRRALWWVFLPLAPAIWLLLRGSMKSLRQFFGIGTNHAAPPTYLELGTLARTVLSWAGYGYGLLALLSVARIFWQWRPVAAEVTSPWLLGFLGANFLGCCLYLIWQARSIHLPGRKRT